MKCIPDHDTIQLDVTTACINQCSNCHHLVAHHPEPYFMSMEQFRSAVDSVVGFPKMVGMIGGDPLLHPDFEEMCEYLQSKIPPEQCGLWSCFPKSKERYREVIVKTFGNIFLNSHERADILHCPTLVSSEELPLEEWQKDYLIDHCWLQESWSPSIIGDKAYFCETAGCLATVLNIDTGWKVEPGWWTKATKEFTEQINACCKHCGTAMPLKKRSSVENIDDISPAMYERLKDTSPKLKAGKYAIHDLTLCQDDRQMATYKDLKYRDDIAARYGLFLTGNDRGFQTPHLMRKWEPRGE